MARIEQKCCLGTSALPLFHREMDHVDLTSGSPEERGSLEEWLLLPLKTTGNAEWLEKFLGKPGRWWKHNGRRQPLMAEILVPLKLEGRIARCLSANAVVRVTLRDKHIDLLNLRSSPTLAFKANPPNFENLVWFLDEMKKDLGSSSSQNSIGASVAGGNKRSLEDEGAIIEEILQKLKSHSNCQNAYFVDAANAFKVIALTRARRGSRSRAATKKQVKAIEGPETDSWAMLGDCFSAAGEEALEFLNGPAGMASASAPMEESPVPEVCPCSPMDNP